MNSLPFKFSQNISHEHPALHSSVNGVVVFEECKHIPAVFHSQTSDQLLHHLSKTRQDHKFVSEEDKLSSLGNQSDIFQRNV